MKKLIIAFLSLYLLTNLCTAQTRIDMPNQFDVTERWLSLTRCFDIKTNTRNYGTVFRKFFSFTLSYEFDDPSDRRIAIARARIFSITYMFDVYDDNGNFLGIADEKLFSFFPAFDLYASDSVTKLAHAEMNFWGTKFIISDPLTYQEIGVMTRPFFRLKDNWTITITNRALFNQKGIDPALMMTVLAFQSDSDAWKNQNLRNANGRDPKADHMPVKKRLTAEQQELLNKVDAVSLAVGVEGVNVPDNQKLAKVADELDSEYQKTTVNTQLTTQSNQERVDHFVNYCLQVAESKHTTPEKKRAILYLLKTRINTPS